MKSCHGTSPLFERFRRAYITQVLVPELRPGDVVVMDNLSSHKRVSVREHIQAAGRETARPPALQRGLQSHKEGVSRLKAVLRAQGARANRTRSLVQDREARRYLPAR